MLSPKTSNDLQQQLLNARREIHNLRKQLNALKHVHRKEIDRITNTLDNWQCNGCVNKDIKSSAPTNDEDFKFKPIGLINSEFRQLRGTPRQPTITAATASLTLSKDVFTNPSHALQDLQHFSHMWIIFAFHKNNQHAKAKVAPPRLNGVRTGVFASRSPHRPCPIGLSLVKIEQIVDDVVHFSGVDMIDQTPVFDIKPYIPQYDEPPKGYGISEIELINTPHDHVRILTNLESLENQPVQSEVRVPPWIDQSPVHKLVASFSDEAWKQLQELGPKLADERYQIISNILQEDPRSVYLREKWGSNSYIWRIDDLCVTCKFDDVNHTVEILKVFREN